jgi:putative tryptophan/tyrosine transport system substrate-binding protein
VTRRKFIALLGGTAAALPLGTHAQKPVMPVIGFLNPQSPEGFAGPMLGLRQGLKEAGYVEGENLTIEYRWANNQIERLPALAADLVRRRVAVIATTGGPLPAHAVKAATTTIPIIFNVAGDPVRQGLVASLARPGGNLTGVTFLASELAGKRLELLHALTPSATRVAALVNPAETGNNELRDAQAVAQTLGLQIQVHNADNIREIEAAFESIAHERPDALYVQATPLFVARQVQLVHLATLHRLPAAYGLRQFADAGGLLSYGTSIADAYRQIGIYAGRILKGAKPADLPVVQASKFELVINASTARMLGLTVPPSLLSVADEVIE